MVPWTALKSDLIGVLFSGTTTTKFQTASSMDDLESPSVSSPGLMGSNEFDFTKNRTKMVYAGAKFCVALCLALVYILLFKVLFTLPYIKTK